MNSLIQAINALLEAGRVKDEAKERWLKLMREGSTEQGDARQAFLARDNDFSLRAGELGKQLVEWRDIFSLEEAVDALSDELRLALRRAVAELRFDHLLAPIKPVGLAALAATWHSACALLDAARAIEERCRRQEVELEFSALRAEAAGYRNPGAWTKAVTVCELLRRYLGDNSRERMSEAIYAAFRHLLSEYDQLTEQLQTVLEDLHDAGCLGIELGELDPDLRRVVQDALASGLVRQRQLRAETKRLPRTVTTIDPETEADADEDIA
jgi:hypothetical protein